MFKFFLKKGFFVAILLFTAISFGYAQTDTVFTNTQKISCAVKEVTPEVVKYTLPGEDVVNSVYNNSVQKIVFKNGRVQSFGAALTYKTVANLRDYDNVTVTMLESDIKGLYKVSDVTADVKGGTIYASKEKVKDRAYKNMKTQAAMMGANVVLLFNQTTEGNKYGYAYTYFGAGGTMMGGGGGSPTETVLTGMAFTTSLPDYQGFLSFIGDKRDFISYLQYHISPTDGDVNGDVEDKPLKITNISLENGLIMVDGQLKGEKLVSRFQVVSYGKNQFIVFYKKKNTCYNVVIMLQQQ